MLLGVQPESLLYLASCCHSFMRRCVLDLQDDTQQGHITSPASTFEPHVCTHPGVLLSVFENQVC